VAAERRERENLVKASSVAIVVSFKRRVMSTTYVNQSDGRAALAPLGCCCSSLNECRPQPGYLERPVLALSRHQVAG
jgi:hypothetical protein